MQIITVAPLARGIPQDELTYFSKEKLPVGNIAMIPVRNRVIPAVVLDSKAVTASKTNLKEATYAIRKIENTETRTLWSAPFLEAVTKTAEYSAQKFSETLFTLTPKIILEAGISGKLSLPKNINTGKRFEHLAIQEGEHIRTESYERLVRESFARNESVFICVPGEEDVLRIATSVGRGIESYTYSFHSKTTKKRALDQWNKIQNEHHAILVVGTAQYLHLPRYFKTIVLDEEGSGAWKTITRPSLDLRVFVEMYAREIKSTLIVGGSLLQSETHKKLQDGIIGEFGRILFHPEHSATTLLLDPRKEEKFIRETTGRKGMVLFTKELRELIESSIQKKERILLYSGRKGLSPVTTCSDCGALVTCPECDTPLVIHKKEVEGNAAQIFICHGCGFMRAPENNINETCKECGSWRLQGLGIGTSLIEQEIVKLFPEAQRFVVDGETTKTKAQAKKIISQFEDSKGGILIATQMAIPLISHIEHIAIVSIDSLFSIPNIRMGERIVALVLNLREKAEKTLLIQTRTNDAIILDQALKGDLREFIQNELATRKAFSYPPYGTIIKITLRGKKEVILSEMQNLKNYLAEYTPITPGNLAREPKNIFRMHLILKLAEDNWPNAKLLAKLRSLPREFAIEVNPDHLL